MVDGKHLAEVIGRCRNLPVIDLRQRLPAPDAIALLDATRAHELEVLPIQLERGHAVLAVADPFDGRVTNLLETFPVPATLVVAPAAELRYRLNLAYPAIDAVQDKIRAFEAEQPRPLHADPVIDLRDSADAPVVQVVNMILTQAKRDRSSDVHIEPQPNRLRVRFRVDGAMREALSLPATMAAALVSRLKIMAEMNIVEQRRPQDGQFTIAIDGRDVDVRVSTTATIFGEKAVLRLLDRSRSLLRLAELGMRPQLHELYARMSHSPFGMIVCSGPTGSGKTTTLYATLSEIARPDVNVMTIEDPVEYTFPEINQIQINEQAGLTFATGLRSILRQDPDMILVGEIRDGDTARIAVQAALTGHLVLSSLHATDSASALARLADVGVEPYLIASSVIGVVAQRLVRRTCSACRQSYEPSAQELHFYRACGGPADAVFLHGAGCEYCANTGYRDRIGVYEILLVSDQVRAMLQAEATPRQIRAAAQQEGLSTLQREGMALVAAGVTTIAEIVRSIYVL
ncbi:MAG: type II/IV secretion system protein [Acidimicrobiales bacterium]|nr:type II/IV secretion system protein [Acidimicrobiales bacterium]